MFKLKWFHEICGLVILRQYSTFCSFFFLRQYSRFCTFFSCFFTSSISKATTIYYIKILQNKVNPWWGETFPKLVKLSSWSLLFRLPYHCLYPKPMTHFTSVWTLKKKINTSSLYQLWYTYLRIWYWRKFENTFIKIDVKQNENIQSDSDLWKY